MLEPVGGPFRLTDVQFEGYEESDLDLPVSIEAFSRTVELEFDGPVEFWRIASVLLGVNPPIAYTDADDYHSAGGRE